VPELKSLRLAGWKSIKGMETPLELRRLNVIIGANGAGKSNLLSYFKLLNEMVGERLQAFVGASGAESLLHDGAKSSPFIEADLNFDVNGTPNRYFMRLVYGAVDTLFFSEERIEFHRAGWNQPRVFVLGGGHRESLLRVKIMEGNLASLGRVQDAELQAAGRTAKLFQYLLSQCRVFHFHDTSAKAPIRQSCYIDDNLHLRPDGGNAPAMLNAYRQGHPVVYERIVSAIRKVAPGFGDFDLEPRRLDPKSILLNWRPRERSDLLFGPHQFSDGTLRAIALTTLLLQPEADLPALIVLDEPELGLHPHAIGMIAGLLKAVSLKSQVIVATQSAAFVDEFDVEDVLVAETADGSSRFRRLDAEPLRDWLTEYSIGDLWRKNVIGGGPVA